MARAGAFLVLLLLSGCVAPPADAPPEEERIFAWDLLDCRTVVAFVPVAKEALAPHLPEGFTPAGGVADVEAAIGVEAFLCESGAGLDGARVAPIVYGALFAGAAPPEELRVDGVDVYWVKWDTLIPDAPRRNALAAEGLPVRDGSASIDAGVGTLVRMSMTLEGVGAFRVEGATEATDTTYDDEIRVAEYMPTNEGLARWSMTSPTARSRYGSGTLEMAPDSIVARIVGATTVPAILDVGAWSFTNGTIEPRVRSAAPSDR
ncbi:MAG TPA: hypothetical protein VFH78_01745 [Candidatus Thermoplasmatota archaeon]|nr:hypothetical protein [Candidatus Thermoplasmatota archaeon]